MIRVLVVYPRNDGDRFDADYWLNTHMPMVGAKLPGVRWEADLGGPDQPHHAVAHLIFPDMGAFAAAATSPGMGELGADMTNYTNVAAQMFVSEIAATS